MWKEVERVLDELQKGQKTLLLELGKRFIPNLTADDLLQPQDFEQLENQPQFRFEEGILMGIETVQAALRALKQDQINSDSN